MPRAVPDRVYNLVRWGYYEDVRLYRVLSGFMAQFGTTDHHPINAQGSPCGCQPRILMHVH